MGNREPQDVICNGQMLQNIVIHEEGILNWQKQTKNVFSKFARSY